jgi:thiol-disulfide isomerase/thioredoxin
VALFVAVALVAAALGFLVNSASRTGSPGPAQTPAPPSPAEGAPALIGASLADLAGRMQPLAQWRGKILVVNFWATWCAPCREEIPALIEVQEELAARGVQIVGIAIDQPDKVRSYAAEMGINYPILVGELDAMELARVEGNATGGLPFTVIVDRRGGTAGAVSGRVTSEKLRAMLGPLL